VGVFSGGKPGLGGGKGRGEGSPRLILIFKLNYSGEGEGIWHFKILHGRKKRRKGHPLNRERGRVKREVGPSWRHEKKGGLRLL